MLKNLMNKFLRNNYNPSTKDMESAGNAFEQEAKKVDLKKMAKQLDFKKWSSAKEVAELWLR